MRKLRGALPTPQPHLFVSATIGRSTRPILCPTLPTGFYVHGVGPCRSTDGTDCSDTARPCAFCAHNTRASHDPHEAARLFRTASFGENRGEALRRRCRAGEAFWHSSLGSRCVGEALNCPRARCGEGCTDDQHTRCGEGCRRFLGEGDRSKVELFRAAIAQTGGGGAWAKARAVRAKGITAATVSEEDDAIIAYVEAAAAAVYYVCTMDDAQEMDQDEQDALVEALGEMLGYEAHEDEIDKLLARWGQYIEADEEGFLAEVAETIRDERAFRETLQLAVVVAAADGELSPPEEAAAYELGHAFGFDDDTCERIIARALRKLG